MEKRAHKGFRAGRPSAFGSFTKGSARPPRPRATTNQPTGSAASPISGGRRPKGKGRRRGNVHPKSVWVARGHRGGRDRWAAQGGADRLARSPAPRLPRRLPALARSRWAAAEATGAPSPRHRTGQNSSARYRSGSPRPGATAYPSSVSSSSASGGGFPSRFAPGCVVRNTARSFRKETWV